MPYYRVKKYRELKRRQSKRENKSSFDENGAAVIQNTNKVNTDAINNAVNTEEEIYENELAIQDTNEVNIDAINNAINTEEEIDETELAIVSDDEFAFFQDTVKSKGGINDKILEWTLKNLDTLRLNVVTELLLVLREEGHTSLPKTAQTLLGTAHHRKLQVMNSNRETEGAYMYLGIKKGLEKIILANVYHENDISVFVHIDGMQIYNNSQIQVWPIVIKVFHTNYVVKPFVAAIYCGDSKPQSSNTYLHDFVEEATSLINNGVELHGKRYSFKICAIIADAPARAFIKNCKAHNAFYACERCTTRGITVGQKRAIKRVYPEMNCKNRSKESFENREQPQHHKGDINSILLQLPQFNIINSVVIDSMHLLFLGVIKNLLEKLIIKKSVAGLKGHQIRRLRDIMNSISLDIPCEFQRKKFDINIISRWKATQFRFFLLYCSSTVLHDILPNNFYRHFLLLFVACRILNKQNVTSLHCDYANKLLRKFFYLLPSLYGAQIQVLNMHYLIHLSDDVKNFKMPLSELSAFWGESYIGIFKKLVKSPNKPLTQIINRLAELESEKTFKIKEKRKLENCVLQSHNTYIYQEEEYLILSRISVNNFVLKCDRPDNVVQLSDNKIVRIDKILLKKRGNTENTLKLQDLYILGYPLADPCEAFNYPISSKEVGIFVGTQFLEDKEMFALKDVKHKCILLHIYNKYHVISLLHT